MHACSCSYAGALGIQIVMIAGAGVLVSDCSLTWAAITKSSGELHHYSHAALRWMQALRVRAQECAQAIKRDHSDQVMGNKDVLHHSLDNVDCTHVHYTLSEKNMDVSICKQTANIICRQIYLRTFVRCVISG